ncbi:hypothetical protein [Aestuariibaculum sediminum]|uniref:Uncharacterized protein n=1 Tax=Aestuariibaculum sediminum TaxID=2770637 RepID=A0A8J6PXC2_9FLAO|nr:hypothetical protein [Aestuariibaculum sediminum]MBD0830572.1 hypothetical protein [Aestuariibaculum sediminum]
MRKIFLILVIAIIQLNYSYAQDINNDILGSWDLIEFNLEGEQQVTGAVWEFKSDGTCKSTEETLIYNYTYSISNNKCTDGSLDNENNYIRIYKTSNSNLEYCFKIINIGLLDDSDTRVFMTLYNYGAIQPLIFVKK